MIKDTSSVAYREINRDGSAKTQRLRVLHLLKEHEDGLLRSEICELLSVPINAVTGRVNELISFGTAKDDGKRLNQNTNKLNWVVKATFKEVVE